MELTNCPGCGEIFVKNKFRDVCPDCWKKEEQAYNTVYQYMRVRANRAATIPQVEEATGVPEELILKFIKVGKLKIAHFPNLGYPCDQCGEIIREGKLCGRCADNIKKDLFMHEKEEERKRELELREKRATYLSSDDRSRR